MLEGIKMEQILMELSAQYRRNVMQQPWKNGRLFVPMSG